MGKIVALFAFLNMIVKCRLTAQKSLTLVLSIKIFLLIVLYCSQVYAENIDNITFIQKVKSKVEDPLPPLTEVIPGYTPHSGNAPSLVVADFNSDRENEIPWGQAIGRIIRRKIMFIPHVILRMPNPLTLRHDAWQKGISDDEVLRSIESVRLVGKRLGIENALTGEVKINAQSFEINLVIKKLPSGQTYKTLHYSGDVANLPETFTKITLNVYEALGVTIGKMSNVYISKKTPSNFEHLKIFAQILKDIKGKSRQEAWEIVKAIDKYEINMPAAAALYAYYMEPDKDLNVYAKKLENIASKFPGDIGIESIVTVFLGYKNKEDLKWKKIRKFQKIIRENPDDPNMMISYGDFLASCGYPRAALTVTMETLKRWPDLYRAWWNMSYAVIEYIVQERGTRYWIDVPFKAKRMFYPLKNLAYEGVNKALEYNQYAGGLWNLKMRTIGEYSPELIDCFYRAIELEPHNKDVYATALNFSLPQWGGSIEAQKQIWDLAVKNNHGEPWLEEIRKEYMKKP